jgi:tape measure domain-containing protein
MAADKLQYEFKVDGTLGVLLKAADLLDKIEKQTKQATISFRGLSLSAKSFATSVGNSIPSINSLTRASNSINEISQAFQTVIFPAKSILDTTIKIDGLNNAIKTASGSSAEATKNLDFLSQISKKMGIDQLGATEGFKTLAGSMMDTKLQGEPTRKLFEQMTYGITALGLSSEDAKGVFLAMGQIMSKGTVSSEELKGQIGERLPGAFNIAARAMGVNTIELNKMLESGKVLSEDFLPKFAAEMEKTFAGKALASTNSLGANWNRLNNSFTNLLVKLGTTLTPAFITLFDFLEKGVTTVSNNFNNFKTVFLDIGTALQPIGNIFNSVFGGAIDKTLSLEGVLNGISWAFKAITPAIQMVSSTFFPYIEFVKKWVVGLIDGFWQVGEAVWQAVGKIMPLLQTFFNSVNSNIDIGYTLGAVFDFISSAIEAVTPWIEALLKILAPIWDIMMRIAGAILKIATWLFKAFSPLITNVVWGVGKAVDFVAGGIASIVNGLIDALKYLGLISDESDRNLKKANEIAKIDKVNNLDYSALNKGNQGLLTGGLSDYIDKQGNNNPLIKAPTGGSDLSGNKDTKKNIEGVSGGGSKPTTINITIGKLNEKIEVSTVNLREGVDDIERIMTQLLMRVVNNANQYGTN